MGVVHETREVFDAVAGGRTCSEAGSSDIDGVGSVADGFDSAFEVACWGK